jgi:hypothetical protein
LQIGIWNGKQSYEKRVLISYQTRGRAIYPQR